MRTDAVAAARWLKANGHHLVGFGSDDSGHVPMSTLSRETDTGTMEFLEWFQARGGADPALLLEDEQEDNEPCESTWDYNWEDEVEDDPDDWDFLG